MKALFETLDPLHSILLLLLFITLIALSWFIKKLIEVKKTVANVTKPNSTIQNSDGLQLQGNFYENLIDNLNLAAFVIDNNKRVIKWNKACEAITGYRSDEMMGNDNHCSAFYSTKRKMLADIVLDKDFSNMSSLYESYEHHSFIEGGMQAYNWFTMPRTGKQLFLEINACPIKDRHGNVIAVLEILLDLSALKKTEDRLNMSVSDLQASNKELEQFAYVASHDLQEPLRTIISYTQLLKKRCAEKLDSDEKEFFGYIETGSKRMHELINDLLQYSRVSTRTFKSEYIDVYQLLAHVMDLFSVSIDETGTVVTFDNDFPPIYGDRTLLQQLFQNLIGNGIKYRDPERLNKVHVSAITSNQKITFCVEDNGIGIEEEFFDKIFVIFQRLHNREDYSGTGIGLSVCKKIVEQHHGEIWLESNPGNGTKFFFSLPLAQEMAA